MPASIRLKNDAMTKYRECSFSTVLEWSRLILIAVLLAGTALQAAERNVPGDYKTIQAAIDASQPGDTVMIEAGTYREAVTLRNSNIVLRGRETARTFLEGDGEAPVVTADGVTGVRISNFTFVNASVGVTILGNADITVAGNVFDGGGSGTAVVVRDSAMADISNNTFYDHAVAINRGRDDVTVRSNLFNDNKTAIAPADLTENIRYNGFLGNDNDGPVGVHSIVDKPLRFIDIKKRDFHLRFNSSAIDKGDENDKDVIDDTRADMGAYGGPYADATPFHVSGLGVESDGADSVTIKWSTNPAYLVAGYNLYYGNDESMKGSDAAEGPSPVDVGEVGSYRLTGLAIPVPEGLSAPVVKQPEPSHQTLQISWSPVNGAAGYQVHYGINAVDEHVVDAGNSTSFRITGLQNEVVYRVAVLAYNQAVYHFAVTAYDSTDDRNESSIADESRIRVAVGPEVKGPLSAEVMAFPEALKAYPDLPDEGCFVATAAYGYYSAPQVQLLRDFRDRYLLTHTPGKLFVDWYYTHAPAAARWLHSYPEAKPLVRVALWPLIIIADFMLNGFPLYLMMLCGILVTMGALFFRRKPYSILGG